MSAPIEVSGPARAAGLELVRGFSWGLRALLAKELRGRSRGWRSAAALTGYLLVLAMGIAGFLALAARSAIGTSPWLGLQLFSILTVGAVLLLAFVTPPLTAGAISGERERRTLDLLLVTRASTFGLVAGKLAGSLVYVLFLLAASLPAFGLVYLYGAVPPQLLMLSVAIAGATAVAHVSLGLVLSAVLRRTVVASVMAYVIVTAIVFGLPFAASLAQTAGPALERRLGRVTVSPTVAAPGSGVLVIEGGPFDASPAAAGGPPPAYAYASPLVALSSALPSGTIATDLPFFGALMQLAASGSRPVGAPDRDLLRTTYVTDRDPTTGEWHTSEVWAPWLYYVGGSLAAAPLAVLVAGAVLAPNRRRRLLRFPYPLKKATSSS